MQAATVTESRRPDWLPRSILSGFIATSIMLFAFVVAYGISLILAGVQIAEKRGGIAIQDWFRNLTNNKLIDLAGANLYLAIAIFVTGGIIFAAFYAYFAEPRLGGPGWTRGLAFSLVLWLLSLVAFLPAVGGGFLGLALGAGPLPIIGNLILHLVYGATLGLVYGPFGDVIVESSPAPYPGAPASDEADILAMTRSQQVAAIGLAVGAVIGAIIGIGGAIAATMQPGGTILGVAPLAFIVASALIGGTCGALIGSLVGLPVPPAEAR